MKKIRFLLTLAIIVSALAVSVFAADLEVSAVAEQITVCHAHTFTVDVNITENTKGFGVIDIRLAFDTSVLELVDIDKNASIASFTTSTIQQANDNGYIAFMHAGVNNITTVGKVATLTFCAKWDAEVGNTPLNLSAEEAFYYDNWDEIVISPVCHSTGITVVNRLPGDVDCDGRVTVRDAAKILQYKAGWDVEFNYEAADVDGDGNITIRDAARILQWRVYWDVTLV